MTGPSSTADDPEPGVPDAPAGTTSLNKYDPQNWRAFLPAKRKDEEAAEVTKLLDTWRRRVWQTHYSHQPFGPAGLLPDKLISTLAVSTSHSTVSDLRALGWIFADKHGPEMLASIESVDKPRGLKALTAEREKAAQQQAAAREQERLLQERVERDRQRERNRVAKEALTARRQQETQRKRREREEKKAAAERAREEKRAAKVLGVNAPGDGEPTKKRRVDDTSQEGSSKRARVDESEKENRRANASPSHGEASLVAHTMLTSQPHPRPRPRPRPVFKAQPVPALPSLNDLPNPDLSAFSAPCNASTGTLHSHISSNAHLLPPVPSLPRFPYPSIHPDLHISPPSFPPVADISCMVTPPHFDSSPRPSSSLGCFGRPATVPQVGALGFGGGVTPVRTTVIVISVNLTGCCAAYFTLLQCFRAGTR